MVAKLSSENKMHERIKKLEEERQTRRKNSKTDWDEVSVFTSNLSSSTRSYFSAETLTLITELAASFACSGFKPRLLMISLVSGSLMM